MLFYSFVDSPFRSLVDNDHNRLMIILVFGSIAHTVIQLALGSLSSASHGYNQLIELPPSIWLEGIVFCSCSQYLFVLVLVFVLVLDIYLLMTMASLTYVALLIPGI